MHFVSPILAGLALLGAARADAAGDKAEADFVDFNTPAGSAGTHTPVDAASDPLARIKEPLQQFLAKIVAYTGHPHYYDAVEAAAIKNGPAGMTLLTLRNWREELYRPVLEKAADAASQTAAPSPDEWWVFFTGGTKSCYGKCDKITAAWNETASKIAQLPDHPHLGYVNCEQQPVLCSAWGAGAGSVWAVEMLPPPADVEVYRKRFNLTSTASEDILTLYETKSKSAEDGWIRDEGSFHPFKGFLAQNGLAVPFGYGMWALNIVPQWAFMLVMSLLSRTFMSRRMGGHANRPNQAPAPRPA